MKTNLLICPVCIEKGNKLILGEIDDRGNLLVMRFKGKGEKAVTEVSSPQMEVKCGSCGEVAFYRKTK